MAFKEWEISTRKGEWNGKAAAGMCAQVGDELHHVPSGDLDGCCQRQCIEHYASGTVLHHGRLSVVRHRCAAPFWLLSSPVPETLDSYLAGYLSMSFQAQAVRACWQPGGMLTASYIFVRNYLRHQEGFVLTAHHKCAMLVSSQPWTLILTFCHSLQAWPLCLGMHACVHAYLAA